VCVCVCVFSQSGSQCTQTDMADITPNHNVAEHSHTPLPCHRAAVCRLADGMTFDDIPDELIVDCCQVRCSNPVVSPADVVQRKHTANALCDALARGSAEERTT
jgi:hypothetical protein